MNVYHNLYQECITLERLFQAWEEFSKGKRKKADVALFERYLENNLFKLYGELKNKTYRHGGYKSFYVRDPKLRHIHKALVRDRIVHHLVSKILEDIFDPTFYIHSYSCRKNMGTHKGVTTLVRLTRKVSKNNTSPLFILKCDVKKFFANVDHNVLLNILKTKIKDPDFMWLLTEIIVSFSTTEGPLFPFGMPIGNLTSQLFANIYLDPLDQFMKQDLKVQNYIRYADDFVVLSSDRNYLEKLVAKIISFLEKELRLSLHPNKISIRDYYLGIDFLGYIVFPHYLLPRTKTKRRLLRRIYQTIKKVKKNKLEDEIINQTLNSYLGYLSHANSFKFSQELKNKTWFWLNE